MSARPYRGQSRADAGIELATQLDKRSAGGATDHKNHRRRIGIGGIDDDAGLVTEIDHVESGEMKAKQRNRDAVLEATLEGVVRDDLFGHLHPCAESDDTGVAVDNTRDDARKPQ